MLRKKCFKSQLEVVDDLDKALEKYIIKAAFRNRNRIVCRISFAEEIP
jgi:hypothetical protein